MRARDRLQSLTVADVMTARVVPVSHSQSLQEIAELFASLGISSAPVVDSQGKCLGIVSAVDLVGRPLEGTKEGLEDVMTHRVKTVGVQEPLLKAAQLMCANHIHRVPVLGEDRRVVGVISTMDIVAAMLNAIDEADAAPFAGAQT